MLPDRDQTQRHLILLGIILFLLGLFTGLAIGAVANPRMGLSAHLEALLNGSFLIALGAAWQHVHLRRGPERLALWLLCYGAIANWALTLLAAVWGTSGRTPIAGAGHHGTAWQEMVMGAGLISLVIAMILGVGIVAVGLLSRRP